MEENTEEIYLGEQEITRNLNAIRNSKKVQDFITSIKSKAENYGTSVKFKSRIKQNESAINKYKKYIEKYGKADTEMWDSCGMMVIVDDIEEIYQFVRFFDETLDTREDGILDYVKNPKAGYRSVHMYSTFEVDGITVPSEIQIKTESMSIAQDTIHDSIYKLKSMPYEKRDELSEALFPIFERLQDAEKMQEKGYVEQAAQLQNEVEKHRKNNEILLKDNQQIVDDVFKEYGKVVFWHHNIDEIEGDLFWKNPDITQEQKEEFYNKINDSLNEMFNFYQENITINNSVTTISGNKGIDYAIQKLSKMNYSDFKKEKTIVEKNNKSEHEKKAKKLEDSMEKSQRLSEKINELEKQNTIDKE